MHGRLTDQDHDDERHDQFEPPGYLHTCNIEKVKMLIT